MRPATALLSALLLAIPTTGQVPAGFAFVLEDGPVQIGTTNFRFVDLTPGGGTARMREQRTFMPYLGVAVDPDDGQVFCASNPSSLAGLWSFQLIHESQDRATWGLWARTAVSSVAIGSDELVFVLEGGGVHAEAISGQGDARLVLAGAGFEDVAVFGTVAWAVDDLGNLTRIDLGPGATTTTLGNFSGATSICPVDASRLLLGNAAGEVLELDANNGALLGRLQPGKGPIVAVLVDQFGLPAFATAGEVWSGLDLRRPLYVSRFPILDADIGRGGPAALIRFGAGCGGASGPGALRQEPAGRPALGSTSFAAAVSGGVPNAPAALLVGVSRVFSSRLATDLPFDLTPFGFPGCDLLVDPVVTLSVPLDGQGRATLPFGIPNQPALRDRRLRAQWISPGGPGTGPATTSDGVTWILR